MIKPRVITEPDIEGLLAKISTKPQDLTPKSYPFDPIQRAAMVESKVMQGDKRLYYRFRHDSKWWAPCVADSVGCCLQCAYCWNYTRNIKFPGKYVGPRDVAEKLDKLSRGNENMRTGGCEPILGERSLAHFVELVDTCHCKMFLLETNGIMLGEHLEYFDDLRRIKSALLIRVTAKADNAKSFEKITGAKEKYFDRPIKAIHEAKAKGFDCELAFMPDFCNGNRLEKVSKWRGKWDKENLKVYPTTMQNLKARECLSLRNQVSSLMPAKPIWATTKNECY